MGLVYLPTYGLFLWVNVGKYTIHGLFGYGFNMVLCFFLTCFPPLRLQRYPDKMMAWDPTGFELDAGKIKTDVYVYQDGNTRCILYLYIYIKYI